MIELSGLTIAEQFTETTGHSTTPGDNLILIGDLDAGKVVLTRGVAQGLGIAQMIKNPTYAIIREHNQGRISLYHMNVYRVAASEVDLGLDEYFEGDGFSVVEQGNLLGETLPEDYLELISEKSDTDLEKRYVELISYSEQGEIFKQRILEKWAKSHE